MKIRISSIGLLFALPLVACGPATTGSEQDAAQNTGELLLADPMPGACPQRVRSRKLAVAQADFNANVKKDVSGSIRSATLYTVGGCADSLRSVVNALRKPNVQGEPYFEDGTVLGSINEESWSFFGTYYSTKGPALLKAALEIGGGSAEGWLAAMRPNCHGCDESLDRTILYFPDTGKAIVFEGAEVWD